VGIDIAVYCMLDFTMSYCGLTWNKVWQKILLGVIGLDIVQFLLNIVFGHAFSTDVMMAYGAPYYNVHSYWGRNVHLALVYAVMGTVLVILLIKSIRGARIYSEKYSIMFGLLMFVAVWEVFYIFSRTPVKRSVIAYAVYGILVFYFSLYYRPRRLLDRLLADLASGMTDGLFFFDDNGKCLWADEHGEKLANVKNGDYSHCPRQLAQMFPGIALENSEWQHSQSVGERYYHLAKHTVYDTRKRMIGSVLSLWDDTAREQELRRERFIANHDPLTGLYTKQHLYDKIREVIDANPDTMYYVAYADIKNFKLINDVFGQEFGDYTLQALASDIKNNMPPGALYGRLGSDIFGLCFSEHEFDAEIAEKYMSEFLIKNETASYRIILHQGVYPVTDRDIDVSVMFDRAHIAMETIKNDYKKHVVLYDDAMRQTVLRNQEIAMQLPDALAHGEISPYLQPIMDAQGTVVGAEALVRWLHPERGLIRPAGFIPVLEDNGTIADIDRHMWRRACEILKHWEDIGRTDLFLSVNVSPKDFYFMDVPAELRSIVREFDLPPERLRIEITESVMMYDVDKRFAVLRELQSDGFVIEMDDFGSGYSSLNMLKDMPVELIKIDMLFLREQEMRSRTSVILRNMIHMLSELGLVPLTEGVETEEQFRLLEEMGCKLFQGFLFAEPLPVEAFEERYLKGAAGA
jgi:diguanylate cyclase (GGDEF)-like protein